MVKLPILVFAITNTLPTTPALVSAPGSPTFQRTLGNQGCWKLSGGIGALIFRLPVILASVLLVNVVDTVWWNGRGGSVTEHRDRDSVTCTLNLRDGTNQASIAWSNRTPVRAVFESPRLRLPSDQIGQIAVRIGDTWLQGGDGKPNIPALTAPSSIMFVVSEPVTGILASARNIDIRGFNHSFSIRLAPDATKDLVNALDRCTAVISRLR